MSPSIIDAAVRFFDLDAVIVDARLLSAEERERVERKATPSLKQRQAASFQCMRIALGEVLGVAPQTVPIHIADGGKPALDGEYAAALRFNVSHSGGIGMLAWGPRELGADVEAMMARPTEALAEEILSAAELAAWRDLDDADRQCALTRAWTRKEAALKAVGSGLRIAPRTVEPIVESSQTVDPAAPIAWTLALAGRRWRGVDWHRGVPAGYLAAVCIEVAYG